MEAGCVADFYAELQRTQQVHDLYRFNTVWIDGAGMRLSESPRHPAKEGGVDFLLARLAAERNVTLQEIIFKRSAWESAFQSQIQMLEAFTKQPSPAAAAAAKVAQTQSAPGTAPAS